MRDRFISYLFILLVIGCSEKSTNNQVDRQLVRVPSEAATIQIGINRAAIGDTVLVADGLYTGTGNRDIDFGGKSVVLLSENGPLLTTIDCEGDNLTPHFAFRGLSKTGTVIEGFTITGAYSNHGSILNLISASPIIRNCILTGNIATVSGGAIRCKGASPIFINCTFTENSATNGGAIYLTAGSKPSFTNCIIAFSNNGGAADVDGGSTPILTCCNLFNNIGGDWTGVIASQSDSNGNLNLDPLFCEQDSYRLKPGSPCLPANNSCGVLIGATNNICD